MRRFFVAPYGRPEPMPLARLRQLFSILAALVLLASARAGEPFRFPEARHGKGELKYVNHLPVLLVQGTPEEIGEQLGVLALKPTSELRRLGDELVKAQGWAPMYPLLVMFSKQLESQFPRDHLTELEAVARASGWPTDVLLLANTLPDLRMMAGCAALIVEADRSATGAPLFGRNQDSPPVGTLHEYALVVVVRPNGKHAFVSITYPGMLGCFSGMNDAGLALADLAVTETRDGSGRVNLDGMPTAFSLRRVLEECGTVDEAEKLLRSLTGTTLHNIAICDKNHGAVFETTPRSFVVRRSEKGVCICANEFRSMELATPASSERYAILEEKCRMTAKLGLTHVARLMDAVSQDDWTQQTMIFEPRSLTLHLAMGKGPATRLPLRTLALGAWFSGR